MSGIVEKVKEKLNIGHHDNGAGKTYQSLGQTSSHLINLLVALNDTFTAEYIKVLSNTLGSLRQGIYKALFVGRVADFESQYTVLQHLGSLYNMQWMLMLAIVVHSLACVMGIESRICAPAHHRASTFVNLCPTIWFAAVAYFGFCLICFCDMQRRKTWFAALGLLVLLQAPKTPPSKVLPTHATRLMKARYATCSVFLPSDRGAHGF
jgi:hypothetical protein